MAKASGDYQRNELTHSEAVPSSQRFVLCMQVALRGVGMQQSFVHHAAQL